MTKQDIFDLVVEHTNNSYGAFGIANDFEEIEQARLKRREGLLKNINIILDYWGERELFLKKHEIEGLKGEIKKL